MLQLTATVTSSRSPAVAVVFFLLQSHGLRHTCSTIVSVKLPLSGGKVVSYVLNLLRTILPVLRPSGEQSSEFRFCSTPCIRSHSIPVFPQASLKSCANRTQNHASMSYAEVQPTLRKPKSLSSTDCTLPRQGCKIIIWTIMNNFPDYRLEHQVLMKLFKKEKKFKQKDVLCD